MKKQTEIQDASRIKLSKNIGISTMWYKDESLFIFQQTRWKVKLRIRDDMNIINKSKATNLNHYYVNNKL